MSSLREALGDYLRVRRRLGFKLASDQRLLESFVGFLEQAGAERITTELALMWARMPADAHPHRWRQRLGIVRGFARYVATLDPASEVPSEDLLPAHRPRVAPYIYSPAEITALMNAARELTPPLRAASYRSQTGRGARARPRGRRPRRWGAARARPPAQAAAGAAAPHHNQGAARLRPDARPPLAQAFLAGVLSQPPRTAAEQGRVQLPIRAADQADRP